MLMEEDEHREAVGVFCATLQGVGQAALPRFLFVLSDCGAVGTYPDKELIMIFNIFIYIIHCIDCLAAMVSPSCLLHLISWMSPSPTL